MAGKSHRAKLLVTKEELAKLTQTAQARTVSVRESQRAKILLRYYAGASITTIARAMHSGRDMAYKCIDKALAMGVDAGLRDLYHRPKEPVITPEAKTWVVHLACTKPKDHGYAAELWTRKALAQHVRTHALAAGHPSLAQAAKATVQRILTGEKLRPHQVRYYLEKRDPDFEVKMKAVLLVYQEIELQRTDGVANVAEGRSVITVSVDEKPGVQAIANTTPDLPPVPGQYPEVGRDHEYERLGTLSILAALDLQDGHVTVRVERRHRSREFIGLLKDLDTHYAADLTIRIILDNHSAHISKETRAYLATRPGRFVYVHTPKHGSWLNLVETLFGKMAHTFLRHMRVASWEELKARVLKGIAEINAAPVIHRWKKFDLLKV